MEEAYSDMRKYTYDAKLKAIIVFGANQQKGMEHAGPYVKHEAVNYHMADPKLVSPGP
jgi:hypothetical protein